MTDLDFLGALGATFLAFLAIHIIMVLNKIFFDIDIYQVKDFRDWYDGTSTRHIRIPIEARHSYPECTNELIRIEPENAIRGREIKSLHWSDHMKEHSTHDIPGDPVKHFKSLHNPVVGPTRLDRKRFLDVLMITEGGIFLADRRMEQIRGDDKISLTIAFKPIDSFWYERKERIVQIEVKLKPDISAEIKKITAPSQDSRKILTK